MKKNVLCVLFTFTFETTKLIIDKQKSNHKDCKLQIFSAKDFSQINIIFVKKRRRKNSLTLLATILINIICFQNRQYAQRPKIV